MYLVELERCEGSPSLPPQWLSSRILKASSVLPREMSQRGDSGTHQVRPRDIIDGKIGIKDTARHDQSLLMVRVPKVTHAAIFAPKS